MSKVTLTLLAVSGSLVAMTLITNPANASLVSNLVINPVISAPTQQLVSLNRATSLLNVTVKASNPIQDQLGCNCPTCKADQSQL